MPYGSSFVPKGMLLPLVLFLLISRVKLDATSACGSGIGRYQGVIGTSYSCGTSTGLLGRASDATPPTQPTSD